MIRIHLLPLFFLCFTTAFAQRVSETTASVPGSSRIVFGKLLDPRTGHGIEAVSVQLLIAANDSLADGQLTRRNGDFSFINIPEADSLRVRVSAIGFDTWQQTFRINGAEKDLGNITLAVAVRQLAGVTVVAGRPAMELEFDRKTFNVAKSLTATGGTAIDVLKNIPSVAVDIEGNVKLRNVAPQIFVDGRPTILTLDQIPAENIEKVELITNPSAKFDAASSGGIINVILKKNKRNGLNGMASLAAGSPHVFNGNLNLNLRSGKFNFFTVTGYNQFGGKNNGAASRINKSNNVITDYFDQQTGNDRRRKFTSVLFGFDFFMDNRNMFTIIQNFGLGRFRNEESQMQQSFDASKEPEYTGQRASHGRFGFNRNSTRLNYKHTFPLAGRELTADLTYNYGNRTDNTSINNDFLNLDGSEYKPSTLVHNMGTSGNKQLTFQADYVHPVSDNTKVETGIRSYHNEFSSLYHAYTVANGQETILPLSNNYAYTDNVNAAYLTYSRKRGDFSWQAGLRAEYAKFDGRLIDSSFKFGYQYPAKIKNIWDAIFPSLFLTQKISESDQLQLNFSRKTNRPDFWQINPYIDISDPVNIRQGNPALQPEFINSFELNYSKTYSGGNFLSVLYWHNNPGDITQYSDTITAAQYSHLSGAGVDPNAIVNTFINGKTSNRVGLELTLQQKWGDNFDITPSADLEYRKVNASVGGLDLSNAGVNWNGKLIVNYKIAAPNCVIIHHLGFQLSAEYESPEVIPQGKSKSEFGADFAMRKDFLKNNKAAVTFGINDIFNSERWGTIYDTPSFYQDSYRRWSVRTFRLSLSYKFGKSDFALQNRKERSSEE